MRVGITDKESRKEVVTTTNTVTTGPKENTNDAQSSTTDTATTWGVSLAKEPNSEAQKQKILTPNQSCFSHLLIEADEEIHTGSNNNSDSSGPTARPTAVLSCPEEGELCYCPNQVFVSDHLPVYARMEM